MRRPVWFRASRLGRVPVHWTPVAWQGWLVVAALMLAILAAIARWSATSPGTLVPVVCLLVAATVGVAALTSADPPRARQKEHGDGSGSH